jgi:hypothetical protein
MDTLLPAKDLLWEEERRVHKARKRVGRRLLLKKFTLACGLIASTIAAATGLAAIFKDGALR